MSSQKLFAILAVSSGVIAAIHYIQKKYYETGYRCQDSTNFAKQAPEKPKAPAPAAEKNCQDSSREKTPNLKDNTVMNAVPKKDTLQLVDPESEGHLPVAPKKDTPKCPNAVLWTEPQEGAPLQPREIEEKGLPFEPVEPRAAGDWEEKGHPFKPIRDPEGAPLKEIIPPAAPESVGRLASNPDGTVEPSPAGDWEEPINNTNSPALDNPIMLMAMLQEPQSNAVQP